MFCVSQLSEGWYCFVTAVGTRTPTTCDDSYKFGKANLSWLTLWLPEAINLLLLPTKSIHYPGNENTQTYQEEVVYLSWHQTLQANLQGNVKHFKGRINNHILEVKGLTCATPVMEDGEFNRKIYFKHKSIGCCHRSVQI